MLNSHHMYTHTDSPLLKIDLKEKPFKTHVYLDLNAL